MFYKCRRIRSSIKGRGGNILRSAIAAAIFTTSAFAATVIDLGTSNAGNWSITGAGAVGTTAMSSATSPGTISITNNSMQNGIYIGGGSTSDFTGVWFADFMFFLPGDAINVVLNFSGLVADDRAVLQLNGSDIGNEALGGPGLGLMNFGAGDNLYTFSAGANSGIVTVGFNVGGLNTVRLLVNNTGTGRTGSTQGFTTAGDGTATGLAGTVSFESSTVPEPGSFSFILLGIAPLAWRLRRTS
jgi:hypothetical protein